MASVDPSVAILTDDYTSNGFGGEMKYIADSCDYMEFKQSLKEHRRSLVNP